MAAERAKQAVLEHCPPGMDEEVKEYLAETAAALFEDDVDDPEAVREDLQGIALPHLEDHGCSGEEATTFCERVLKAAFGEAGEGGSKPKAAAAAAGTAAAADSLCCVPNLLLMYGGSPQPLLRNARLELVRGRRYGVVGANGTGKTTLMARLASKDIVGFPQDVGVVHLRYEAILRGVKPKLKAREFAQLKNTGATKASEAELEQALREVGFDSEEMLAKAVGTLSGGWQMRLALACAMAQKASLLLLDEPTNHLDTEAVRWLVDFINRVCVGGEVGGTAIIVSHDADFLNEVCTHVIHFTPDAKLVYHDGNFEAFKQNELKGDEAKAKELLEVGVRPGEGGDGDVLAMNFGMEDKLVFPSPGRISNAGSSDTVVKLIEASFQHKGADGPVLKDLSVELQPSSRVAIVGRNGAGKSTLLSLLAGRLAPYMGELWTHPCLRLVYIAQHHESQLGEFLNCTPVEYMQLRFKRGFDAETMQFWRPKAAPTANLARRAKELAKRNGRKGKEVECVLSRQVNGKEKDGKDVLYEVKWKDLGPADNTFEKRSRLISLGVEWMADEYDERISNAWGDSPERPLTSQELADHFADFGLPEEVSTKRSISMLSSGQRSKLMLAVSFWTRPHFICLDEPTNALDSDTIEALTKALRNFRGGYAIVSHSENFVKETCEVMWTVADGGVTVSKIS